MKQFWLACLWLAVHQLVVAQCTAPVIVADGPLRFCAGDSVTLSVPVDSGWTRKADYGGIGKAAPVGFSIGSKGYIGTGYSNGYGATKDFWEYDSATDAWTQKADFGGNAVFWATGFSIGNKGYIGTGLNGTVPRRDFWEYDPAVNTWTRKADFGNAGSAMGRAVGFRVGSKGYIGVGEGANGSYLREFWEYDPATDAWTRKADFGGIERIDAAGFGTGTRGYIGTGYTSFSYLNDLWEYNPATDTWVQKADMPGSARYGAVGFSIGNRGYIGLGFDAGGGQDFWEYNPATDSWTAKGLFSGESRDYAAGFSIGNKGYVGAGQNSNGDGLRDFWAFKPADTYWWSPGGQNTPAVTITQSGSYTLTVTDVLDCSVVTAPVVVTADSLPKPVVSISGPVVFNPGDSVILTAPAGFAGYMWSNGDTARSVTVTAAGTYRVVVKNNSGCFSPASDPVAVSLYGSPVIFVSVSGSGNKTGLNWANAIANDQLPGEMSSAAGGSQFWLKAGTYYPTAAPSGCGNCDNGRDRAFLLQNGIALYGGFAGTEYLHSQRNITANPSVLDGNGNYHVVISIGNDTTARLDGFTITGGKANGYGERYIGGQTISQSSGGGVFNAASAPGFFHCIITANTATSSGAGMQNHASAPFISYCTFSYNSSNYDGGAMNNKNASPVISNSAFISNTAANLGGGIANNQSASAVTGSHFSDNRSYAGGGISNYSSSAVITGTAFAANSSNYGGGVYNIYAPDVAVVNAVFASNTATQGGAVYNNAASVTLLNSTFYTADASGSWALYNSNANPVVTNSIIWSNAGPGIDNQSSTPVITHSIVKNGYPGTGNLGADPLFVNAADPDGPDNLLGTPDDGLNLQACSPAVNTGDNSSSNPYMDVTGRTRVVGSRIDRGAYEYQDTAGTIRLALNGDNGIFMTSANSTTPLLVSCRAIGQVYSTGADPVAGAFAARVWVNDAPAVFSGGRTFVKRHYELSPAANAANATARVTLYASQQEFHDFNTSSPVKLPAGQADAAGKANLRIFRFGGQSSDGSGTPGSYLQQGMEINPEDSNIVWNSSLDRWEICFDVTGFSGFFIGSSEPTILPITLLGFSGKAATGNEAVLSWHTANEVNAGYFELQRSTDGSRFTAVTQLPARGGEKINTAYNYTDKGLAGGMYYYRLRMVDKDGKQAYSPVVNILFKGGNPLSLYPTPAKKELWLGGNGINNIGKTALLMDMQGRILQQVRITQWPQRIELTALAAGTYLVRIDGDRPVFFVKE